MPGAGRRWGFHRLAPQWADRLVLQAGVRPGRLVVDLGAGDGALTLAAADAGARVIAVELHPGRVKDLRRRTAGRDVSVVPRDLDAFRAPSRPFQVVANPPFALATATLRRITARGSGLRRADLVLPVPLARQWLHRGIRGYRCELGLRIPAEAFLPRSPRQCVVLVVRR